MRILYVATSFPVYSETFLQREVRSLLKAGVELMIVSLHRGASEFEGHVVNRFTKWSLFTLLYLLPRALLRKPGSVFRTLGEMISHRPRYWLNIWENLLGFGAGIVLEDKIRSFSPDLVHCVWSGGPAAFGLAVKRLTGLSFSTGAHAYDLFEHGGDWLLEVKLNEASFVHVSTAVAKNRAEDFVGPEKIALIRRGLIELPKLKSMRIENAKLRIVCVARLVEKKGFPYQIEVYRRLRDAGIDFEARIIGDGPMRAQIERWIQEKGLADQIRLTGRLSQAEVVQELLWADMLFHTGVVAASGDRDGLPNVVPEAMAAGAIVVASPVSGVVEAIRDAETGFLCEPGKPEQWLRCCRLVQENRGLCETIQGNARMWVERQFVAEVNTGKLIERMEKTIAKSEIQGDKR